MRSLTRLACLLTAAVAVSVSLASGQAPAKPPALLATAPLAAEVRDMVSRVGSLDPAKRRAQAAKVRDQISDFIVRQIDAMPSISQEQLQQQLREIVCDDPRCQDMRHPIVRAVDWGPRSVRRQIVAAYALFGLWNGPGGSLTAIENYLWEGGRTRRTARGGAEFDGYALNVDEVARHPDTEEYWLLAWGTSTAASGRAFCGQAAVYRVGVDAVTIDWRRTNTLSVTAHANAPGWEVSYADGARLYSDQPKAWILDVYQFDWSRRTHQLIASVHFDR